MQARSQDFCFVGAYEHSVISEILQNSHKYLAGGVIQLQGARL